MLTSLCNVLNTHWTHVRPALPMPAKFEAAVSSWKPAAAPRTCLRLCSLATAA
jgi:hypothetical protein